GQHFTAKDFRTWAATVLAAQTLRALEPFDSETQAKRQIVESIEDVARQLGNTPTICRKCYVHPAILDAHLDGTLVDTLQQRTDDLLDDDGLDQIERDVLHFLRLRLEAAT
ncbi:MAG TPA: hypothetical protein VFT99_01825, partial [Roseiflexaceae bacterium]|nr:hypothetical protein [Roseiflexaceae bacterium]